LSPEHRLEVLSLEELVIDPNLTASWRHLAASVPDSSYFQTPDWVVSWWETIGGRPSGSAALVWEGARLSGVLALAKTREPLTRVVPLGISVLTNAGSGIGTDHAGWLAAPGAEDSLRQWLGTVGPVLLKGVPMSLGESLGGRLIQTQRCPRLVVADLPGLMSAKLAKTLRNAQRRLAREGVEFSFKGPGEVTLADLEVLYELNRLRRTDAGDRPIFDDPLRRAFHERMLPWAGEGGGTAILQAAVGEQIVGALYGFTWQATYAYYQVGWDPRFRQLSLGSVLVLEAIEECARQGIEIFDFLRGADDYKYRFGATDLVEGSFAVGRSPRLTAIGAANSIRSRIRKGAG
jgi:CelD/BcsL family acetyltransferase involved in cellulose biosynthesis